LGVDVVAERKQVAQGFRDLDVYQRGFSLVRAIYDLVGSLPGVEKYDLASQMRRASKSIPANIAEGYALRGDAPRLFCKHLRIAYGSAVEMQVHCDLALELGYISGEDHGRFLNEYEVLAKMIYRLWQHWRKRLPVGITDE
jgi:four helix bundle protein